MSTWYQQWFHTAFYHKLYFEQNEAEAHAFIHRLLRHLQPRPDASILHINCGHGLHTKMLAAANFTITGIDATQENIALAQQSETYHLHFYTHDLRLPFWINYFDYAFSLYTFFGYHDTYREHENEIRTISQSLKPGGILFFDMPNVHYSENHLQHNEIKKIGETRYEMHRWHDAHHFYNRILISDPALEKPLEITEKLAKFSLGDFTDMLALQNMQVTEVFGDYQLKPYDVSASPRMIMTAKKRTAT